MPPNITSSPAQILRDVSRTQPTLGAVRAFLARATNFFKISGSLLARSNFVVIRP